jgi:ArsR family transcriptional regulator, arsenate/arsenite/antimonite-responsive transcriptional repressor
MEITLIRLKALADPARLQLVQILADFPDTQVRSDPRCSLEHGVCSCHLEERLGLSAPTISHHLKVLREANLVEMVKLGKWTYYRLQVRAMDELLGQMSHLRPAN